MPRIPFYSLKFTLLHRHVILTQHLIPVINPAYPLAVDRQALPTRPSGTIGLDKVQKLALLCAILRALPSIAGANLTSYIGHFTCAR